MGFWFLRRCQHTWVLLEELAIRTVGDNPHMVAKRYVYRCTKCMKHRVESVSV